MDGSAPATVLAQANDDLYQDFSLLSRFATVFLCCFEHASRRAIVANAGHSPVIYRPAGGRAALVYPTAVPLGVLKDWKTAEVALQLGPRDLLIAATDGFTEAEDPRTRELFGLDRLLALVDEMAERQATDIAAALFQATDAFGSWDEANDDRTVVVLRGVD
jgi:sigma-B regulation protein RsbU (phosphoserine phosphatase)